MKKRILTIVDLQTHYLSLLDGRERESMMDYVYSLVQLNKYDLIINLSYDDEFGSSTDKRLRKILRNTKDVFDFSKSYNNGAPEVFDGIYLKGFNHNKCDIELVGVNTDACVIDTFYGLVQNTKANIYIHKEGVGSCLGIASSRRALRTMKKDGAIII